MDEPLKAAKDTVAVVAELIKAAGDNPEVKAAGHNLGRTALTLTSAINNALLPLAAVNFAFDKARRYFNEKFADDMQARAATIPADCIIEPKGSIAGPALQALAFTHDEPNLKDMYLSLLSAAMDARASRSAHPAFVEIIKQLEADEAPLLKAVLTTEGALPIAQIRKATVGGQGYRVIANHLMNLCDMSVGTPVEDPRIPAMVDNWVRLGLCKVDYSSWLSAVEVYSWVEERPEYKKLKAEHETETEKISHQRGRLGRTDLGIQFATVVGLT